MVSNDENQNNQSLSWRKIEPLLNKAEEIKKEIKYLYKKRHLLTCVQVLSVILFFAILYVSSKDFNDVTYLFSELVWSAMVTFLSVISIIAPFAIEQQFQRQIREKVVESSIELVLNIKSIKKEQNSITSDLSDSEIEQLEKWIFRLNVAGVLNPTSFFVDLIKNFPLSLKIG
jgi:hypothetical protein